MKAIVERHGRKCRICGRTGVPEFQREHVACRDYSQFGYCTKCDTKLRVARKPGESGMCKGCHEKTQKALLHRCAGPDCEKRIKPDRERCWACEDAFAKANRPPKMCRKCKTVEIKRKQGQSVCAGCTVRKQTREARQRHESAPSESARILACGDTLNREQVGAILGVSHERVRQIEVRALKNFARNWQLMFGTPLRDECSHSLPTVEPILDECG